MKHIFYIILFVLISCDDGSNLSFFSLSSDTKPSNQDCDSGICTVTETFELKDAQTSVDIVLYLDVSESNRKDLNKIGRGLSSLLTEVEDLDWQMAFSTADHGDHIRQNNYIPNRPLAWKQYTGVQPHYGRLMSLEKDDDEQSEQYILDKNTPNYQKVFLNTMTTNKKNPCESAPYCQGDHEQPLRSLKATIDNREHDFFFRELADFVSIIITDEDERGEDPSGATTAQEVKDSFYKAYPYKDMYSFSFLVKDGDKKCLKKQRSRGNTSEYGTRISELAAITGGKNISICEKDYGKSLAGISQLIKERVLSTVYLGAAFPKPDSIEVTTNPFQEVKWELKGRHIKFTPFLQYGTVVQVTYEPLRSSRI